MPSDHAHRYLGPLRAVVLDWAGTTVDYGCMAPVATFMQAFAESGVPITVAEARAPMGMPKWQHIQAITRMEPVAARWHAVHGSSPQDETSTRFMRVSCPCRCRRWLSTPMSSPASWRPSAPSGSRGIAIASTTGYPREVMDVVVRVAAEQGYETDVTICAGDTPAGRPGPFMALQALIRLSISPVEAVVKIGDTAVDIEEGLNGGMWSVGVAVTGNEVGLTAAEYAAQPAEERLRLAKQATERLLSAGAHYVVDSLGDVLPVLEGIEERLANGDKP